MELLTQLLLENVEFEDKKAVLTFLDEDRGEIREVIFNKKVYENGEYVDSDEKAEKVEKWCEEEFGLPFVRLAEAIGERKDVYAYDGFNSLFHIQQMAKFDNEMVGQIMEVDVSEVVDDGKKIAIRFEHEGETYESKMSYADYLETRKEWFVNPQKKVKQYKKFEEKFGIAIEEKEKLVGKQVMIEIKKAMGKYVYIEIKPFPKRKR